MYWNFSLELRITGSTLCYVHERSLCFSRVTVPQRASRSALSVEGASNNVPHHLAQVPPRDAVITSPERAATAEPIQPPG
jgi:hypothetical protein